MALYMFSVLDDTTESATAEEMAAIDAFNEQLRAEGLAVSEVDGPEVALAEIDGLPLEGYHAFHATQADLLRRRGRSEESRAAYDRALELAGNSAERAYLIRRRDQLAGP